MLVESKSNLARLMATENLIVEQRNVQTASFDLKSRILTVPVLDGKLSPELYDLLLGHEVGHALETPEEGWHNSVSVQKVNHSILNVCEDVRIEKKIKNKFPGIRISFLKGYKELMERDFFGVADIDVNTLNLIDRINLHTKAGAQQNINFSQEELVLLKEVESTNNFDEVIEIAKKIQEFMKAELEEERKKEYSVSTDEDITSGDLIDGESDGQAPVDSSDSDEDDLDSDAAPKAEKQTSIKELKKPSKIKGSKAADITDKELESKTDNSFRENEKSLFVQNSHTDICYSNIPDISDSLNIVGYEKMIKDIETFNLANDYKDFYFPELLLENYNKFRVESNRVVSYLVKEFEMRKNAEQQSRVSISKTGEINMSKIQDYRFTDDIFARMTNVPNGKSHGLVMFVDWSGSMIDYINSTIKQLLNLVMFCKKVNIPFEVYAFSTEGSFTNNHRRDAKNIDDIEIGKFSLLNLFSSKMSNKNFSKMASFMLGFYAEKRNFYMPSEYTLNGTPLNECIISAFDIVPKFKQDNKLQIVNTVFLTDGDGSMLRMKYEYLSIDSIKKFKNILPTARQRSVFRDPVTKAEFEVKWSRNLSYGQTTALLKLLKIRIGGNLIGFFITNVGGARESMNRNDISNTIIDKNMSNLIKENFAVVTGCGYDEQYYLRSNKLDTDGDGKWESAAPTTTRKLASEFSKYTSSKINNRIVLNRFIKLIA